MQFIHNMFVASEIVLPASQALILSRMNPLAPLPEEERKTTTQRRRLHLPVKRKRQFAKT
jgi:hypothetical protein